MMFYENQVIKWQQLTARQLEFDNKCVHIERVLQIILMSKTYLRVS